VRRGAGGRGAGGRGAGGRGAGGRGAGGASVPQKVLMCRKSEKNS